MHSTFNYPIKERTTKHTLEQIPSNIPMSQNSFAVYPQDDQTGRFACTVSFPYIVLPEREAILSNADHTEAVLRARWPRKKDLIDKKRSLSADGWTVPVTDIV